MAFWFVRGVRRGVVTTRYPAGTDPSSGALPTPPSFVPARLTAATVDRLVEDCPSRALEREGMTLILDVGACTACGECQRIAPDAVVPSGIFELAATERSDLLRRIPIAGGGT